MTAGIIRVFPRLTKATPTDSYAFVGNPPMWWPEDATEVHVSVTFTWDLPEAERIADAWTVTGLPVKLGGPATGQAGGDFVPGMYLKPGYVITSRGCDNRCWFCYVPKREGGLRELPITNGWNVADDNLLACSFEHTGRVFDMLERQPRPVEFTGGLEAERLHGIHCMWLARLKPRRFYFAYDTPNDLKPLQDAGRLLQEHGFKRESPRVCAYVFFNDSGATESRAEKRLRETWDAGFWPFAMLYRDDAGKRSPEWITFQRRWANPWLVAAQL
jgi:hypothetical protein